MQKKNAILGAAILITGAIALSPKVTAYQGDPKIQGPNYSSERHEIMTKAFENNDFNSWKKQMEGKGRVAEIINEDNFGRFAEAHKLASEGDLEGSKKIREELGLGLRNGSGEGFKKGNGAGQRNNVGQINQ